MSRADEAAAACKAALETGKKVWVSWTLSEEADGTLISGETIEEAVAALPTLEGVDALLFNCSSIEPVDAGLPRLRACIPDRIKIGAYANGFHTVKSEGTDSAAGALGDKEGEKAAPSEYRKDLTPEAYAQAGAGWVKKHGACIVGGCCGIFPEHIKALSDLIKKMEVEGVEGYGGESEVAERPAKLARRQQ